MEYSKVFFFLPHCSSLFHFFRQRDTKNRTLPKFLLRMFYHSRVEDNRRCISKRFSSLSFLRWILNRFFDKNTVLMIRIFLFFLIFQKLKRKKIFFTFRKWFLLINVVQQSNYKMDKRDEKRKNGDEKAFTQTFCSKKTKFFVFYF